MRLLVLLLASFLLPQGIYAALAPVLGVDLGNEYMKISAIAPGHNLEMILNTQSKRKTRTVLNLANQIRQFGESAFAQQTMQPGLTMQYWTSNIGLPDDMKNELTAKPNSFDSQWYPYQIKTDEGKRHTLKVDIQTAGDLYFEELMAHQLSHAKDLVKEHLKDISYPDDTEIEAAFAVPVSFTYRQRQLLRQSANVAGIRPVGFIPEPLAAAISHTLDMPAPTDDKKSEPVYKVFLDVGSKYTQACLAKFEFVEAPESVRAGFGRQRDTKEILSVETIKCHAARPGEFGAHQLDILIADFLEKELLKREKIKPSDVPARSRRRLLRDANKIKHTLSTNKDASIFIEGYAKGKDLKSTLTRDQFDSLITKSGWLNGLSTIKHELGAAFDTHRKTDNLPTVDFIKSLDSVELIGGGWRVPHVLAEIEKVFGPPGQKCNSDEAMAVGAAMVAANHSSTYKFRPILATTLLTEPLFVDVSYLGEDNKQTILNLDFPAGTRYGASRKRVLNLPAVQGSNGDAVRVVARDGKKNVLDVWTLDGINLARKMKETNAEKVKKAREKFANLTSEASEAPEAEQEALKHVYTELQPDGGPSQSFNVSLTVSVNHLGLVSIEKAVAGWEDVSVQETTATKTVTLAPSPEESSETSTTTPEPTATETGEVDESSTTSSSTSTPATKKLTKHNFVEQVAKQIKQLTVTFLEHTDDSKDLKPDEKKKLKRPYPMTPRQVRDARSGLKQFIKRDKDVEKLNELKNRFETYIYDVRSKLREDEEILKVSTEKEREKLMGLLQEHEDWLYDHGGLKANFTTVEKRLNSVKDTVGEVLTKAQELKGRTDLIKKVLKQIEDTNTKISSLQESKAWLKDVNVVKPVKEAIEKFVKWFEETRAAQEKLSETAVPILTKALVDGKWKAVSDAVTSFSKTRKPSTKKKADEL